MIDGEGDTEADYAFRLLDLAAASAVPLGTPIGSPTALTECLCCDEPRLDPRALVWYPPYAPMGDQSGLGFGAGGARAANSPAPWTTFPPTTVSIDSIRLISSSGTEK